MKVFHKTVLFFKGWLPLPGRDGSWLALGSDETWQWMTKLRIVKSCWKYETFHLRLASIKFWQLWLHSLSLLGVQTNVHWSENLTTQISNGKSAVRINSSKPQAEPFSWVSQETHSWMSEALCPLQMECRAPEICVHDWFPHLVSHFQFVYKYCRVVLVGIKYRSSLITSFRCLVDTAEHWVVGRKVVGSTTDSLQTFGGHTFSGTPKRHSGGDGAWVPYHGNPRRAEWTLKATLKILNFCLYFWGVMVNAHLLVTHSISSRVGVAPPGAEKVTWGSPPTQYFGLLHPGRGRQESGRGEFFSSAEMLATDSDVVEGQGKSPPLWALPPEGEPTPWAALGIRGEGGTGGGGGTTWLPHDPPPPTMSAPGPGRLSLTFMDMLDAEVISLLKRPS